MKAKPESKALILLFLFVLVNIQAQEGPVNFWKFESIDKNEIVTPVPYKDRNAPLIDRIYAIKDEISGTSGRVQGNFFRLVPGVSGNALRLDGITDFVKCEGISAPDLNGNFTIGAWIALGGYPVNCCPVATQGTAADKGYFLGIDAYGHAGFKIYSGGKLYEITSEERIPLRKWKHLAGVYSKAEGIALYLDGRLVASLKTEGEFNAASGQILLMGKHSIKQLPEGTLRPKATDPVYTFFDGLLDEVMIFKRSLSSHELSDYFNKTAPSDPPAIQERSLPSVTSGPAKFGAFYTSLNYYDAWDALWPVGDEADVVVRFDKIPGSFVFWRGTNYIPNWVTENGIWYNNEFTETWGAKGCHEPMSDKRCQFSNVRILENNDARVVVHWRYALVDNWANMANIDTLTGWGEWTDEVYTIYPDGVAVREITLYSKQPHSRHEFHEAIIVMGPGQRPEHVIHPSALTLANLKGETYTYSWEKGIPPEADKKGIVKNPAGAVIQLVNTKSELKPFVVVNPETKPTWNIFNGELRKEIGIFPWWNHWPTAQNPSDGRLAMDSDQASHSSLANITWDAYSQTVNSVTKLMLNGLTVNPADKLVSLAKSWIKPPELRISGSDNYKNNGYDPSERAYQIDCSVNSSPGLLNIVLEGTAESPAVNPCFVIKNWGTSDVSVKMNNTNIEQGKAFRYGFRNSNEGTDLIVWIEKESEAELRITCKPVNE